MLLLPLTLMENWVVGSHRQKGQMIDLPMDMYQYQLSAVVTHEGKLDNGHYWADVRNGSEWFRCDDDKSKFSAKEFFARKDKRRLIKRLSRFSLKYDSGFSVGTEGIHVILREEILGVRD